MTRGGENNEGTGMELLEPALDLDLLAARVADELGARYAVEGYLGSGAFATVWKVFDRAARQLLGVKRFAGPAGNGRGFYREMSSQFRLQHARVVRIVNLLETPTARFLFLEFCPGGTLRSAMARGRREGRPCSPERARVLAVQLASGLAAAHRCGLVHRDLKPENILFDAVPDGPFGGSAGVRLADFGLARLLNQATGDGALQALSGSPRYMAPEQFIGRFVPASDVYALGVILFELLHGQAPFTGSPEQLARQHLREAPRIDPTLPPPWPDLLARLLDKDSERRPAAADLMNDATWRLAPALAPSQPTAESVLPLDPPAVAARFVTLRGGTPQLLVANARGVWHFPDGREHTALPGLTALETDGAGGVWAVRNGDVLRLRPEGGPPALVSRCPGVVRAFTPGYAGLGPTLIVDDEWIGSRGATAGAGPAWRRPLRTSGFRPLLARLADGKLVAAEGPVRPRLLVLDPEGTEQAVVPLPGPCWDLGALAVGAEVYAVLLMENDLRGYRVDLAAGAVEPLDEGIDLAGLTAAPLGRAVFGLRRDGTLLRWGDAGPVEQLAVLGADWSAFRGLATDGRRVAVLGQKDGRPCVGLRGV